MSEFSATIGFSGLDLSTRGDHSTFLSVSRGKVEVGKAGEEGEGLIAGSRASDPLVIAREDKSCSLLRAFRWRRNDAPSGFKPFVVTNFLYFLFTALRAI